MKSVPGGDVARWLCTDDDNIPKSSDCDARTGVSSVLAHNIVLSSEFAISFFSIYCLFWRLKAFINWEMIFVKILR